MPTHRVCPTRPRRLPLHPADVLDSLHEDRCREVLRMQMEEEAHPRGRRTTPQDATRTRTAARRWTTPSRPPSSVLALARSLALRSCAARRPGPSLALQEHHHLRSALHARRRSPLERLLRVRVRVQRWEWARSTRSRPTHPTRRTCPTAPSATTHNTTTPPPPPTASSSGSAGRRVRSLWRGGGQRRGWHALPRFSLALLAP